MHSPTRRAGSSDTCIRAACGTLLRCSEGASRLPGFLKWWLDELGEAETEAGADRLFQLQPVSCISAETLGLLSTSSNTPLPASTRLVAAFTSRLVAVLGRPGLTSRR